MTSQEYINQAVAAGIPLSAIQGFLSGNPGDYSRILSALGPDYIQGSGASVTTIAPGANVYASPAPYATPTPVDSGAGMLTTMSPSDAMIAGHGSIGAFASPTSIMIRDQGASPAASLAVQPAPSIPSWAMLVAFAVLAYLFLRK